MQICALSDELRVGFLTELGRDRPCAIICSEAVWWRCHRRFVAYYLLSGGKAVFHLMGIAQIDVATLNQGRALMVSESLLYRSGKWS